VRGNTSFYFTDDSAATPPAIAYQAAPAHAVAISFDPNSRALAEGRANLRSQGCTGCHAHEGHPNAPSTPPSFLAIARRYERRGVDRSNLIAKVRNGGGTSYGTLAMPPQRHVPADLLPGMVAAILVGEGHEAAARQLPADGRAVLREHGAHAVDYGTGAFYRGRYRLRALADDGSPVGAALELRHNRLLAIDHDAAAGLGRAEEILFAGVRTVTPEAEGAWISFDAIDLRELATITLQLSALPTSAGSVIELRSASPRGPLLAEAIVVRDRDEALTSYEVSIQRAPPLPEDVYVVFRWGSGKTAPSLVGLIFGLAGEAAAETAAAASRR
jgi:cytochrome c551/c552